MVDDDPRNLIAVEEVLRSPGVEIVTADSGEAALRHVLKHDFAVILLDVQMPRLDGYEVASLIRNRPRSSRVPILFLTAFNKDDMHVFKGYSAGAVDYVFKPIEPLILKSKVDIFVDLYRKTEEIRRQAEQERRLLMDNLHVRSEKLKAEQALRRREEHQSIVLQSLPIALYTASVQEDHRQLHFTNESIERITGFAPEAFLETSGFLVVPDQSRGPRPRACATQAIWRRRGPSISNIAGAAPTASSGISSIRRFSCGMTMARPVSSSECGSISPSASRWSRTCSMPASWRPSAA